MWKNWPLLWSAMSRSPAKRVNKVGRPARNERNKTILLRESTFNIWNQKKIDLGFQENTNSEFAKFLLDSYRVEREQDSAVMSVAIGDGTEDKRKSTTANSEYNFVLS